MKTVITFFCLTLVSSVGFLRCHAQIPKRANEILVLNELSKEANFGLVTSALLAEGFEIEDANGQFFTVKSGLKSISRSSGKYYLYFICRDRSITVTGNFQSGIEVTLYGVTSTDQFEPIQNRGMQGSVYREAFVKMDEFAHSLNPSRLEYSIRD